MVSKAVFRRGSVVARCALLTGLMVPALTTSPGAHAEPEHAQRPAQPSSGSLLKPVRAKSPPKEGVGAEGSAAVRHDDVLAQPALPIVGQDESTELQAPVTGEAPPPVAQPAPPAQPAPAAPPVADAPTPSEPPATPADDVPAAPAAPAAQAAPAPSEPVSAAPEGAAETNTPVEAAPPVEEEFDWAAESKAANAPVELGEDDVITVTVDRRERDIQDYAGSAEAFSGGDLERENIVSVREIAAVTPYIEIGNQEGNLQLYIRGVGTDYGTELGDPAIATHFDGIYLPRPRGVGSMFFDINRVEVNRGPQGTLRGRNATGGSINVITNAPELGKWDAGASLQLGNYSQKLAKGMINVPIGDTLALRFAAFSEDRDSFYKNAGPITEIVPPENADTLAYRMSARWVPVKSVQVTLRHDYTQEMGVGTNGTNFSPALNAGLLPEEVPDARNVNLRNPQGYSHLKNYGVNGSVLVDFGPVNMELLSSYRGMRFIQNNAANAGVAFPGQEDVDFDDWSRSYWHTKSDSTVQELRFFAPDSSAIRWTAGGFFFNEEQYAYLGSVQDKSNGFAGIEFNMPDVHSDALAAYADATFDITEALEGVLGLRFTSENKERTGIGNVYGFYGGEGTFRHGTAGFAFATDDRDNFTIEPDADQPPFDEFFGYIDRAGVNDTIQDWVTQDGVGQWGGNMFPQKGSYSKSFIDFRAGLNYDLSEASMVYGQFSTAHKSGGFNDNFTLPDGTSVAPAFDPEVVYSTEVGSKNTFLDKKLTANFTAFWYEYTNQQFQKLQSLVPPDQLEPDQTAVASVRFNAAQSRVLGLEADMRARLPAGLAVNLAASLLNARFTEGIVADSRVAYGADQPDVDITGNVLPRSPTLSLNYGIEQVIPTSVGYFDWTIRAQTKTKQFMTLFNGEGKDSKGEVNPLLSDVSPAFTRLDLAAGFAENSGRFRFDAFVTNATDVTFMTALINTPGLNLRFFNPPRQFGVRLTTYM